jgi:Phytanoyl-CoA dioxygenase (PhyH)
MVSSRAPFLCCVFNRETSADSRILSPLLAVSVLPHRGSAVQYARTYGYSFSLFIALQDTYSSMGATRICPGTHMCGEDQSDMCAAHGFQPLRMHKGAQSSSRSPYWKRGDAVLFNQQLAHHGEAHKDGPPRVMVVVSFMTRPNLEIDNRVLSAGLFSFSLWDIWGLTWQDLYHTSKYTSNQWYRKFRSLGLWKPSDTNWGLDFVTKSIMEWNMGENGMEPPRLSSYAQRIHRNFRIPRFLQGRVIEVEEDDDVEEDPYHVYISTTFQTWSEAFVKINFSVF